MNQIPLYSSPKAKQSIGCYADKTFWQVERMHNSHFPSDVHHKGLSEQEYVIIKEQTWFLVSRAYQNIYGLNIPTDPHYQQTLLNAAMGLRLDNRAKYMSERDLLHVFEDIIRISDEHQREAQQHLSKASNAVYLREMALDNALESQKYMKALHELMPNSTAAGVRHTGRLRRTGGASTADVLDLSLKHMSMEFANE